MSAFFFSASAAVLGLLSFSFVNSQDADCDYSLGRGLDLNLSEYAGRVLTYKGDNLQWTYSICSDALSCFQNSQSVNGMVEVHEVGINECHYYAQYNASTQPFYDFAIASWIFNYSTGEPCPDQNQQLNRTTTILYNCNELLDEPYIVDVFEYDSCNALMQIDWKGACAPDWPPNEKCEFRDGLRTLDLSSIKGRTLTYWDNYNLSWHLSPCSNEMTCRTSHGTNLAVMADVDDPTGQCIKFLGVWSGDSVPFYETRLIGDDYWDFFWMNGEECGAGGPLQGLNVRYYCNPTTHGAQITSARGVGPCQFRFEVDTELACRNASMIKDKQAQKKAMQ